MIARYHIEDLIRQDSSGVDYRALDTETNAEVALRRFFPFGPEGGGLEAEEQDAYLIALERLSQISHPSLRQVVGGGCDPVDGMPFIVTEWCDGPSLEHILPQGEPDVSQAVEWIMQALEVSELLSHLLTEQAVWVETDAKNVLIRSEKDSHRATFLISPFKWLGNTGDRSLQAIVDFAEILMDWHGRIISDQAGRGLGGWVNWLRGAASTTTLQEARDMLAASVGAEAPPPTSKLIHRAMVSPAMRTSPILRKPVIKTSGSKAPIVIVGVLLAAAISLAIWISTRPPAPQVADAPATLKIIRVPQPAAASPSAANDPSPSPDETIFTAADSAELVKQKGATVTFQGVLQALELSSTQKTLILQFAKTTDAPAPCGIIRLSSAGPDLSREALEPLKGKTLRIRGKITVFPNKKDNAPPRPDIQIHNRLSIEVVEPSPP